MADKISKFLILHNITGAPAFVAYAASEDAALNLYAGYRSGYETLAAMAASRNLILRDAANVKAILATEKT